MKNYFKFFDFKTAIHDAGSVMCKLIIFLFLSVLWVTISAQPDGKSIIAKGAELQKLAGGYIFTEGPACDAMGNVFFTDQNNNIIVKWSTNGRVTVFTDSSGRANGMFFDKKGNLIACADKDNELWSVTPDGKVTVLLKEYEGKRLNGPNDLWIAPWGGIYFTDPFYKRPWWDHTERPQDGEHVYYLTPDYAKVIRVISDLEQPNGIIGTPDGKYLYVADIRAKKTYRYTIQPDKSLSEKKLFAEMGSDGMTIDNKGNIYLTGNGVTVFNPDGIRIEHIPVPEKWTGNVCFGGNDRRLLFITASTSVYGLQMKVKGVK